MSIVRSRQPSEKMDNRAALCMRVANKFQAAVHRTDARNPCLQFDGLILMVQEDDPLAAGYDVIRKVEPHALEADVGCSGPPVPH